MRSMTPSLFIILATALLVAGCSDTTPGNGQSGDDSTAAHDSAMTMELRIVAGENGPAYPDAKMKIVAPAANAVVGTDSILVKAELTGMELAAPTSGESAKGIAYSKEGQHIHVIIDDKPYMAMYAPDGFMVPPQPEGVHTLRAFPSRSWHESVKSPGVFVAHTFYVGKKSGTPVLKEGEPLLTYSRPKGDYKGNDAKRILLDFYISNAELGADKYKVIASIDGKAIDTLTEWVPYFIEGLTAGSHTIGLQLIGPDGAPVPGAFNMREQMINVMPDTTAMATHQGH